MEVRLIRKGESLINLDFTVYLGETDKRRIVYHPNKTLQSIIEKLCWNRKLDINNYVLTYADGTPFTCSSNACLQELKALNITEVRLVSRDSVMFNSVSLLFQLYVYKEKFWTSVDCLAGLVQVELPLTKEKKNPLYKISPEKRTGKTRRNLENTEYVGFKLQFLFRQLKSEIEGSDFLKQNTRNRMNLFRNLQQIRGLDPKWEKSDMEKWKNSVSATVRDDLIEVMMAINDDVDHFREMFEKSVTPSENTKNNVGDGTPEFSEQSNGISKSDKVPELEIFIPTKMGKEFDSEKNFRKVVTENTQNKQKNKDEDKIIRENSPDMPRKMLIREKRTHFGLTRTTTPDLFRNQKNKTAPKEVPRLSGIEKSAEKSSSSPASPRRSTIDSSCDRPVGIKRNPGSRDILSKIGPGVTEAVTPKSPTSEILSESGGVTPVDPLVLPPRPSRPTPDKPTLARFTPPPPMPPSPPLPMPLPPPPPPMSPSPPLRIPVPSSITHVTPKQYPVSAPSTPLNLSPIDDLTPNPDLTNKQNSDGSVSDQESEVEAVLEIDIEVEADSMTTLPPDTLSPRSNIIPRPLPVVPPPSEPLRKTNFFCQKNDHSVSENYKPPPIIQDISTLTREDGTIQAAEFVEKFRYQYETNYAFLEAAHLAIIQHRLNFLIIHVDLGTKLQISEIFTSSPEFLEYFRNSADNIRRITDLLSELLLFLEGHLMFCQSVLENVHLESFSSKLVRLSQYFSIHRKILEIFELREIPALPLRTPYVMELRDDEVVVNTEEEFRRMQSVYFELKEKIELMERSVPTKWPQTLPNLSTHDGKPILKIRDKADFGVICASYCEFVTRMEQLNKEWGFSFRTFYKFQEKVKELMDMKTKDDQCNLDV